jgi:prepilin-type N-terminal cleavage/methylation domain-containing protein
MVMRYISNKNGFTLIEMMCIVVIIGIIATVSFPKFETTIHRLQVRNTARHMVSTMRLARSNAISQKQQVGVHFSDEGTTMTMFVNTQNPTSYGFEPGDSVISIDTLPRNFSSVYTEIYDPENPCSGSVIVYMPNGTASTTTNLYFLAYSEKDDVDWGTIEVLAATGRTRLASIESS